MIELGLQRIAHLLAQTPLPWRAIHVAGTNGKGSVCAYISGMIEAFNAFSHRNLTQQALIKQGKFTSPHLIDRWDCISVNQTPVSSSLFHEVEARVLARNAREGIQASEFEMLTATAFEIFTQEKVDIAVVEVGLGGRLDATNVLGQPVEPPNPAATRPAPLVTAIAKIGLDHQGFLGNTVEEIAKEKAGIIKCGVPLVYDNSNTPSVLSIFESFAAENQTKATNFRDLHLPPLHTLPEVLEKLPLADLADLGIPLPDRDSSDTPIHTRQNTSVAFRATWLALQQLGRIPPNPSSPETQNLLDLASAMLSVPAHTNYPGRLQNLSIAALTGRTEPVLLDGAHNAQSAAVLAGAVDKIRNSQLGGKGGVTWVLAVSDSKDARELLSPLLRPGDKAVAVEFGEVDGMPWVRAVSGEKVLEVARELTGSGMGVGKNYGQDVVRGLRAASTAAHGGPMVIAGSLYLVGSILRALREVEAKQ